MSSDNGAGKGDSPRKVDPKKWADSPLWKELDRRKKKRERLEKESKNES